MRTPKILLGLFVLAVFYVCCIPLFILHSAAHAWAELLCWAYAATNRGLDELANIITKEVEKDNDKH